MGEWAAITFLTLVQIALAYVIVRKEDAINDLYSKLGSL